MSANSSSGRPVAVITGAAAGIGAALAREAAKRGFDLALADRDPIGPPDGSNALVWQLDVADPEAMDAFAGAVFERFGRVDCLFNNAGLMRPGRSWDQPRKHWDLVMNVNLGGVINGVRAFTQKMIDSGRPCRIVNTASLAGLIASPGFGAYGISKHAVVALSETLSMDLAAAETNVSVSVVCPGGIATDIMKSALHALDGTAETQADARATTASMVDSIAVAGATPDTAAKEIFDSIDAGDFWILPNAMLGDAIEQRAASIASRKAPVFVGWA